MRNAFKAMPVKTDRKAARHAQFVRLGWFWHCATRTPCMGRRFSGL
jgi:hypothetical protein